MLDEYEGKMAELLQSLHAVERAFVQQREQHEAQLKQEDTRREEATDMHRPGFTLPGGLAAASTRIG